MFEKFFNENYIPASITEDEVLGPLQDQFDAITDTPLQSFAKAILLAAPEWFWTAPSSLEEGLIFEDESATGGLVVHLKRTFKIFELLAQTANLSPDETNKGRVAILVGQIDKYQEVDGELSYNLWAAFSACTKIDQIVRFNEVWGREHEANTIMLDPSVIGEIKRLIRVQDGRWTPVPEIRPQNTLELVYHQSWYVGSGLKYLVDYNDSI